MNPAAPKKRLLAIPAIAAMIVACALRTASPTPPQAPAGPGFAEIEQTALDLGARFGPDRILLVFDLDNTLYPAGSGFMGDLESRMTDYVQKVTGLPRDEAYRLQKRYLADYGLTLGVDWVAVSFVQRPEEIVEVKRIVQGRAGIVAKLEKPAAIDCLEAILTETDAVMVRLPR